MSNSSLMKYRYLYLMRCLGYSEDMINHMKNSKNKFKRESLVDLLIINDYDRNHNSFIFPCGYVIDLSFMRKYYQIKRKGGA